MTDAIEPGEFGGDVEDFLRDDGRLEEATARAVKRVIAFQLRAAMDEQKLSKVAMAARLKTSRAQLDRLLDPDNASVTLDTLSRAARAVGREIVLELR